MQTHTEQNVTNKMATEDLRLTNTHRDEGGLDNVHIIVKEREEGGETRN